MTTTYILMDGQNPVEYWEGQTLEDLKTFYSETWSEVDFDSDREYNDFMDKIEHADIDQVEEWLNIMEFEVFKSFADMMEWRKELGME